MNKNITLLSLYASSSRYDFFILKDELQKMILDAQYIISWETEKRRKKTRFAVCCMKQEL